MKISEDSENVATLSHVVLFSNQHEVVQYKSIIKVLRIIAIEPISSETNQTPLNYVCLHVKRSENLSTPLKSVRRG